MSPSFLSSSRRLSHEVNYLAPGGVVLGDRVVLGDGVVRGDGVVLGDSAVQAMAATIHGDPGLRMR